MRNFSPFFLAFVMRRMSVNKNTCTSNCNEKETARLKHFERIDCKFNGGW